MDKLRKSSDGCQGLGEGENEEILFRVHGVSIWKDEKSLEDAWWRWLHNNVNVCMPLKYMLKNGKVCVLYCNKIKSWWGGAKCPGREKEQKNI